MPLEVRDTVQGKRMLRETRNEARLVFPQRGWGPKYPTSRGLFLLRFA